MRAILIVLVLLTTACTPRIRGSINGFTDGSANVIPANATVAIVPDNAAANALFEREVRLKLERALASRGYRVTSRDDADYLVYASFGVGAPHQEGTTTLVYQPGTTATVRSGSGETVGTVTTSGHLARVPTTYTQRDHWLKLGVARASEIDRRAAPDPFPWLWQAETLSNRRNSDLRYTIDYLIVPTVELFGQNTQREVRFSIKSNDDRVRVVRGER